MEEKELFKEIHKVTLDLSKKKGRLLTEKEMIICFRRAMKNCLKKQTKLICPNPTCKEPMDYNLLKKKVIEFICLKCNSKATLTYLGDIKQTFN